MDKKYGAVCRSLSYNIVNSRQDAEECVNDAYLGAWKQKNNREGARRFRQAPPLFPPLIIPDDSYHFSQNHHVLGVDGLVLRVSG